MKSIRLLPVVIFAALALLVFKGIGLVSNGGYVLTGPVAVIAQEGGGAEATMASPSEATMTDASPTLGDTAPTLAGKVDTPAATGADHGAPSSAALPTPSSEASAGASSSEPSASAKSAAVLCPETAPSVAPSSSSEAPHDLADKMGNALAKGCPAVEIPINEHGDVLPSTKDGSGKIVPLATTEGDDSQAALLERLGERRAELDKRQADLDMRESLVAAAEQKLDERTRQLADLQAQVTALVDEKQAAEDAAFKAIVSMYETMKPKDAAKIFDTLDLNTLLKVSRAMNPRKMSPILAAMNAVPAQALTTAFATTGESNTASETASGTGQNLAALPQIVGH